MKNLFFLTLILLFVSCNYNLVNKWENYDESEEIKTNATIENKRLQFKRIQSISNDKNKLINGFHVWLPEVPFVPTCKIDGSKTCQKGKTHHVL